MLQSIGDKLKGTGEGGGRAHRWFWYLILGVLILVFAAWGPYAVVDLSFGRADYAAKVNDEKIPIEEVNDNWQRRLPQLMEAYGGELSDEQRDELQQEVLAAGVREVATLQRARQLGFRVSDAMVQKAMQEQEAFQIDGKFSLQEARARIAGEGLTEKQYVDRLKKSLLTNHMLGVIGATDFLTPAEAKRLLALLDEQRELRFILLDPEKYSGSEPVTAEAIEAYYKSHQEDFAVPEAVRLAYAELSLADVAATVVVTEEELKRLYEESKSQYIQPETRKARHILIPVADAAEDAAQAAAARDIYTQIKGGADFAALARQHSKDPDSAANGGELAWSTRNTMAAKELADKVFAMKVGEVSEPVKSLYGYHIVRLDGIRPEVNRTLDDVRAEMTAQLRTEKATSRFNSEQDRLQELVEGGSTNLDALVKEFGMRRGEVARFERGAGGLPLGSDVELNREVFSERSIEERRIGGPAQLSEDRATVFRVEEHFPATTRPLEEVRDDIVASLRRERGAAAALQVAQRAVEDLKSGKSFDAVAAALKVKAEPARFVARAAPDLPVEVRDALFAAARPTPATPVRQALKLDDGSVALFESANWQASTQMDVPQLIELRSERELQRYTGRDINAYINTLVSKAKVRLNPAAFVQ